MEVLILIFLENALRPEAAVCFWEVIAWGLNPYFFGKCSTALISDDVKRKCKYGLNPYFFGKCSTAQVI